jgi:hypothetical protein
MAKHRKRGKTSKLSRPVSFSSDIIRWKDGDTTKPDPLFILVINNIALERKLDSNNFVADMSTGSNAEKQLFTKTAEYIKMNLFGELPGQAEKLLADSPHSAKIKFWSMYVSGLAPSASTSLVAEDNIPFSRFVLPRRDTVVGMLASIGMNPDIVYLVTKSPLYDLAHSWGTTDDDSRGGIASTYDGAPITHRFYHKIPGMVALNVVNDQMAAAHEFGHAFSSYTNGFATDLYLDGDPKFNRKVGRPIPDFFAEYHGINYPCDKQRNSLGYDPDCPTTYHPELADPAQPALMDNYHEGGMLSRHDKITKAYVLDRVAAKVSR